MRSTDKTIEVLENVLVEKKITKESISSFTSDKTMRTMTVNVDLLTANKEVVENEIYYFDETNFIDFPSESDLWIAIDEKRTNRK